MKIKLQIEIVNVKKYILNVGFHIHSKYNIMIEQATISFELGVRRAQHYLPFVHCCLCLSLNILSEVCKRKQFLLPI